jgi:hypothetical protein
MSFWGQRQQLLGAFCEAIQQLTMLLDHDVAAVISGTFRGASRSRHPTTMEAENA